jgi:SWI/SNF and RSC complexes subunit Ssr4 N-terminal
MLLTLNQQQAHVHLVSTYRYPALPSIHPDKVAEWLSDAPRIARDQASFYWTYLDRPIDGTILLVWQSPSLGNDFPSDGYIWAPGETAFQVEVAGGYVRPYHG